MTPTQAGTTSIASEMFGTWMGPVEGVRRGEGPAVLLLHGAMGGWDQAFLLARAGLGANGFEAIAISRPGYLRTPQALGRTPAQQADLYAALLDALGIQEVGVVAVSAGGPSGLQFALRHPARCRALVMLAACSAPLTRRVPLRFHLMVLAAHIPALLSRMRRKVEGDLEAAARRSIPDPVLREQILNDRETGPLLREFQLSILDHLVERLPGLRNDIAQCRAPFAYPVETIQAPVLIVHGTADDAVPFGQAESLAARLPHAELLAIQGGTHMILFTHLHLIQPRIRQFLAEHFKTNRS